MPGTPEWAVAVRERVARATRDERDVAEEYVLPGDGRSRGSSDDDRPAGMLGPPTPRESGRFCA